jgi:filamentous hemagglutinin family protein
MKLLKKLAKERCIRHTFIYVLIYSMLFLGTTPHSVVLGTPTGADIVAGDASVAQSGNTTSVTLNSDQAIINWDGLDTLSSETLEFLKGSGGFAVLNRVMEGGATHFDGTLLGNQGHIIIVNPRGIIFGPTAFVDAYRFTASGLNMSRDDFMNGRMRFQDGCGAGTVTNSGRIEVSDALYLIGKSVTNTGTISCPGGMIVMAAGEKVYLAQSGSDVIVEKLDTGYFADEHTVTSGGTIDAAGAGILLAAGDIFSQAVITGARSFVAQADRNVNINGALDIEGNISLYADNDHILPGNFRSTASISASGDIDVRGNDVLFEEAVDAGGNLTIKGRDCTPSEEWPWGNVTAIKTLDAKGNIAISVTGEKLVWVPGYWVTIPDDGNPGGGNLNGNWNEGNQGNGVGNTASGNQGNGVGEGMAGCGNKYWVPGYWNTEYAPGTIYLYDNVTAGGNLAIYNNTYTGAGVTLKAGNDIIFANDGLETTPPGFCEWLKGSEWLALRAGNEIQAPRTEISVTGSTLIMEQGLSIDLDNFLFANQGNTDLTLISNNGSVTAVDTGTKPENAADKWNSIGATALDNITLAGSGSIRSGESGKDTTKSLWAKNGDIDVLAGCDFSASKDITAGGNIRVTAGDNIRLMGNAAAGQNITLAANEDVEAQGDLTAGGNIEVYASDDTIYLGGDVLAGGNVLLNNNTRFTGWGDQHVEAGGTLTANGWLKKLNYIDYLGWSGGSLYLHAVRDITLAYEVIAAICCPETCWSAGGGVSIISDNGRIFTPDGLNNDTLNVPITGRSVDAEGVGVGLPYGPGRAAIVIMSSEDLRMGAGAELTACGAYDGSGAVDDRAGVRLLDVDAEIPTGIDRDKGDPFDLAIYAGSRNGSVEVSAPVTIVANGTMVADAYDKVTLGDEFKSSLAAGKVGDRLEVVSRVTEWLDDAAGRLPFPEDLDLPENYNYVMRGAGLENIQITDGRAWVLEKEREEISVAAAPIPQPELKSGGCPALMSWVANELSLEADQLQIYMDGSLAMTSDVQPCDMCARLQGAALALMDAGGTQLAALARVVNAVAAGPGPVSDEQMAMIAASLKKPAEGSDYALAAQWLDSLVQYVSILNNEMGMTADESAAFAAKYTAPVTGGDNAAVAAYVQARLAALGG